MRGGALLMVLAALAGCSLLPRDPDGTTKKVAEARVIRVGETRQAAGQAETGKLVARLERAAGAKARVSAGDPEPLLASLEHGELDVVVAWFDGKTPWADRVALAPPLAARGSEDRRLELRAAIRNGENRWAMLVEKQSRAVAPELAE